MFLVYEVANNLSKSEGYLSSYLDKVFFPCQPTTDKYLAVNQRLYLIR